MLQPAAWKKFVEEGQLLDSVPPMIGSSWKRSRSFSVNPYLRQAQISVSNEELSNYQETCQAYHIYMDTKTRQLIRTFLTEQHVVLTLANSAGLILLLDGDDEHFDVARENGLVPGSLWSEAHVGTNSIGTCLALQRLTVIRGREHYCQAWHPFDCASIPIFSNSNELTAVLSISAFNGYLPKIGTVAELLASLLQGRLHIRELQQKTGSQRHHLQSVEPRKSSLTLPIRYTFKNFVGTSQTFRNAVETAERIAATHINVLLEGETGTGKELFAQAIHHASRPQAPFIAMNCGALSRDLVLSELFGYEEGAFTGAKKHGNPGKFEQAHGGTLFLDEVGELPLDIQVMLLRALQNKEIVRLGGSTVIPINVRVIAATHRDLAQELKQGRFRIDLYYRLNVVKIKLPPLRDRAEDIPLLWQFHLNEACSHMERPLPLTPPLIYDLLQRYTWPGNVRELQNVAERAAALAQGEITLVNLPPELQNGNTQSPLSDEPSYESSSTPLLSQPSSADLKSLERQAVKEALLRAKGNKSLAADLLGMSRPTLYRKIREHGFETLHP